MMDDRQRQRLVASYRTRVIAAEANFYVATRRVPIEPLVRDEPEHNAAIHSLLLDVIGLAFSSALPTILAAAVSGELGGLAECHRRQVPRAPPIECGDRV